MCPLTRSLTSQTDRQTDSESAIISFSLIIPSRFIHHSNNAAHIGEIVATNGTSDGILQANIDALIVRRNLTSPLYALAASLASLAALAMRP